MGVRSFKENQFYEPGVGSHFVVAASKWFGYLAAENWCNIVVLRAARLPLEIPTCEVSEKKFSLGANCLIDLALTVLTGPLFQVSHTAI
jgi:hypothetical protein